MRTEIEQWLRVVGDPMLTPARRSFEDAQRKVEAWCCKRDCAYNKGGKCYAPTLVINEATECERYEPKEEY